MDWNGKARQAWERSGMGRKGVVWHLRAARSCDGLRGFGVRLPAERSKKGQVRQGGDWLGKAHRGLERTGSAGRGMERRGLER